MPREAPWKRDALDPERLPESIQALWKDAVDKMAAIYSLDLAEKPHRRIVAVERIANLVILMPPEIIRAWLED